MPCLAPVRRGMWPMRHTRRERNEKKMGAQNGVRARKVRNVLYGDGCKVEASPKDLVKNEVAYHATAI